MKEKIIQNTVLRFILVGVINTLVGTAIMFGLYNLAHCSYWVSSASNYILTSILSFFLNKFFTFQNKEKSIGQVVRFAVNIAEPLCLYLLSGAAASVRDNISMLVGMCLFTAFNYCGQRFFAFRNNE